VTMFLGFTKYWAHKNINPFTIRESLNTITNF